MKVSEIRIKVYTLNDIPVSRVPQVITHYIDSSLAKTEELLNYHENNQFKNYCFNSLYPIEKDMVYKKDRIYTFIVRTVDVDLARYFSEKLSNHCTNELKGLTVENQIIPKKTIDELYTLTPIILKTDNGYWKNTMSVDEFEKRLFENAVKKYNEYANVKINEDFQFYTNIKFLNKNPISIQYKRIHLLGDKICIKIADNEQAQDLAYFIVGTGLCEMNSRGYGYCNYHWL